jgi:hypothetical protein
LSRLRHESNESQLRWIGFSEDDESGSPEAQNIRRRSRFLNALRTTRSTADFEFRF